MNLEQYLETQSHYPPARPADVRRRLALFLNVIDALRDARARGVAPLEIQPASFLVLPVESRAAPRVRLVDAAVVPCHDPRLPGSRELVEVHRLGVLLYRLMSGRPPEPGLRSVMLRALAPNPEHRFADIDTLAAAVSDVYDGSRGPRTASRVGLGVAIAVAGILLISGAERLAGSFHGATRANAADRREALRSMVDGSVGVLESELPEGTVVRASALATMSSVYRSLGLNDEAETLVARVSSVGHAALAWARRDTVAHTLERLGPDPRPDDVSRAVTRAASGPLRRAGEIEEVAAARELMERAAAERRAGDALQALPLYERALGIYAATLGADHPRAEACVREIASTVREIGDRTGADRVDRKLRAWELRR